MYIVLLQREQYSSVESEAACEAQGTAYTPQTHEPFILPKEPYILQKEHYIQEISTC